MTLIQCKHALIHHISAGACADYRVVDADITPRPDRSACRAISAVFFCPPNFPDGIADLFGR